MLCCGMSLGTRGSEIWRIFCHGIQCPVCRCWHHHYQRHHPQYFVLNSLLTLHLFSPPFLPSSSSPYFCPHPLPHPCLCPTLCLSLFLGVVTSQVLLDPVWPRRFTSSRTWDSMTHEAAGIYTHTRTRVCTHGPAVLVYSYISYSFESSEWSWVYSSASSARSLAWGSRNNT